MPTIDSVVLERLRAAALEAAARAYAPYSRFYVGAALLFEDGTVFTGCNVENVSYGLSCCAERNALYRSISERGAGPKIAAIAVANRNGAVCTPCGACRQVMSEFTTADAVVTYPGETGPETRPFVEIFPSGFTFTPQDGTE